MEPNKLLRQPHTGEISPLNMVSANHGLGSVFNSTLNNSLNGSPGPFDFLWTWEEGNYSMFTEGGGLNPLLLDMLPDSFFDELRHDFYRHHEPMTITLIIMYSMVFVLGLLGNVFVVAVVIKYPHMRTLTNTFLVSLTIGDLLVVIICIPMTLCQYIYTDYVFGVFLCKLTPFLQGIAVAVSSLSLLSISLNRYFAIHNPLKAKILFSRRRTHMLLCAVWTLSVVSFIPTLVVNDVITTQIPGLYVGHVCMENWKLVYNKQIFSVFIFVMLFTVPLAVMSVTYSMIGWTLWRNEALRSITQYSATGHCQSERILRQRRRTVKMLVAVVLIYFVCWFPYYIVMIWLEFNSHRKVQTQIVNDYLYPVVLLFGLSNSTVNPVCYCLMSKGFKRAFLQLFCRRQPFLSKRVLLMVRFKSSEDSPIDSLETALTQ